MIFEPFSEINNNIKIPDKQFVKIGELKWKDYVTNIVYSIEINEDLCVIISMFGLIKSSGFF